MKQLAFHPLQLPYNLNLLNEFNFLGVLGLVGAASAVSAAVLVCQGRHCQLVATDTTDTTHMEFSWWT